MLRVRVLILLGVSVHRVLLAVPFALLAAGCSSNSAPTGPPLDGGTYASADDVLSALAKAGVPCVEPSAVADPTVRGVTSLIDCGSGAGKGDTTVSVYVGHADAVAYAQGMIDFSGDSVQEVVGLNWVVNTHPPFGVRVQAVLGGSVVSASPSPTS